MVGNGRCQDTRNRLEQNNIVPDAVDNVKILTETTHVSNDDVVDVHTRITIYFFHSLDDDVKRVNDDRKRHGDLQRDEQRTGLVAHQR